MLWQQLLECFAPFRDRGVSLWEGEEGRNARHHRGEAIVVEHTRCKHPHTLRVLAARQSDSRCKCISEILRYDALRLPVSGRSPCIDDAAQGIPHYPRWVTDGEVACIRIGDQDRKPFELDIRFIWG